MLFLRCCPLYFYFMCMRVSLHAYMCGHRVFTVLEEAREGVGASEPTYRQL